MQCSQASRLMSLSLDGLLDSDAQNALDEHLSSCLRCEEDWESLRALSQLFEATPMAQPAPGFAGRVVHRVTRIRAGREVRRRAFLLLGSLVVLSLLTVPSLIGMGSLAKDLVAPSMIGTGVRVLSRLISVFGSIRHAVALLFSAFFSTPAAVLAPAYVAIALAAVFLWTYLLIRARTSSATNQDLPIGFRFRVQNSQEVLRT
jgi:anti-sigma factor RsiW